jgi:hypothetical protein
MNIKSKYMLFQNVKVHFQAFWMKKMNTIPTSPLFFLINRQYAV